MLTAQERASTATKGQGRGCLWPEVPGTSCSQRLSLAGSSGRPLHSLTSAPHWLAISGLGGPLLPPGFSKHSFTSACHALRSNTQTLGSPCGRPWCLCFLARPRLLRRVPNPVPLVTTWYLVPQAGNPQGGGPQVILDTPPGDSNTWEKLKRLCRKLQG